MPAPDASQAAAPTLTEALRQAAARLRRAGIENAGEDARRLAAAVLGLTRAAILREPHRALSPEDAERLHRAIARRLLREPVSRIIGTRDFYGRSFCLSPATLDPRPDSETVVTAAIELVREEGWLVAPLSVLDIGTGSGCLIVTLLLELPAATGVGTDISATALAIARHNARSLGVEHRSRWIAADGLAGIDGRFDVLVCNPPYIPSAEIARLEPEVRDFDPHAALDGGGDGLSMFRRLAAEIGRLVPEGWIILEVGDGQADAVTALLAPVAGGSPGDVRLFRDVAGRRRCVALRTRILPTELMICAKTP
jgi:release factor glutamine methyltransferase